MRPFICASLLLTLTACGSGPAPLAADFYGLWQNTTDGTVRVFEFAASADDADLSGLSDVYRLYMYAEGAAAEQAQRGSFEVAEGDGWELVTTVTWTPDGTYVGQSFGNPIEKFDDTTLELLRDDGTTRVYTATDAMP